MRRRDLAAFLGLEIFAIIWAAGMFSLLNSKMTAGFLAGGYFVLSGIFMMARAARWPRKWTSLTWYMLFVHVFVISIPLLVSRLAQMGRSFEDVMIFGLPGPLFHRLSSTVFTLLIVATIVDGARAQAQRAKLRPR